MPPAESLSIVRQLATERKRRRSENRVTFWDTLRLGFRGGIALNSTVVGFAQFATLISPVDSHSWPNLAVSADFSSLFSFSPPRGLPRGTIGTRNPTNSR